MTVEGMKSIFDWATVLLLFLTFAAGLGLVITGNVLSSRQEEKLRNLGSDLTTAKSDNLRLQSILSEQSRLGNIALARLQAQQLPRDFHSLIGEGRGLTNAVRESLNGKRVLITSYEDDPEALKHGEFLNSTLSHGLSVSTDLGSIKTPPGEYVFGIQVSGPEAERATVFKLSELLSKAYVKPNSILPPRISEDFKEVTIFVGTNPDAR